MEATRERTSGSAVQVARERGFLIGSHAPDVPMGIVLLMAMSDGRQHNSQDAVVGQVLRDRGLASLRIRLLSIAEEAEERHRHYLRFRSEMLAQRLEAMVDWLTAIPAMAHMKLGLMASKTEAAAAALTAARRPDCIAALVLCDAVLDEVEPWLPLVRVPTMLVVSERCLDTLVMSEKALALLGGLKDLAVLTRASHGYPQSGPLGEASRIAGDWFLAHLVQPDRASLALCKT